MSFSLIVIKGAVSSCELLLVIDGGTGPGGVYDVLLLEPMLCLRVCCEIFRFCVEVVCYFVSVGVKR